VDISILPVIAHNSKPLSINIIAKPHSAINSHYSLHSLTLQSRYHQMLSIFFALDLTLLCISPIPNPFKDLPKKVNCLIKKSIVIVYQLQYFITTIEILSQANKEVKLRQLKSFFYISLFLSMLLFCSGYLGMSQASACYKPRLLYVVDKSGSMTSTVPGTSPAQTRWQVVGKAISDAVDRYHNNMEFGMSFFHSSAAFPVEVPLPANPHTQIKDAFSKNSPGGGTHFVNAMNTAVQEIERAIKVEHNNKTAGRRYAVMFLTDGSGGTCPITQVTNLRNLTITHNNITQTYDVRTYAVGMTGANWTCLQQMATAGGTGTYSADLPSSMQEAFNWLTYTTTLETCNGLDDDCDGRVDNIKHTTKPLERDCYPGTDTGCVLNKVTNKYECKGICKPGLQVCLNAQWTPCIGDVKAGKEICDNGFDDNCDGKIDEKPCICIAGKTQPCYSGTPGTEKNLPCKAGTQTCQKDGTWGACEGEVVPTRELCNGKDDNCNGLIDEDYLDLGKPCTVGTGACARTSKYECTKDGLNVICPATPGTSSPEKCNGIDDDCDGLVDEDWSDLGKACTIKVGNCIAASIYVCKKDGSGIECIIGEETCNGKDDDCDGKIDNIKGTDKPLTQPCYSGHRDTRNVGECKDGVQTCTGGKWSGCVGEVLPKKEICNGLDDNCNGTIDEDFLDLDKPCTVGISECKNTGKYVCKADGTGVECGAKPLPPQPEQCNGKDDDCDGKIDNIKGTDKPITQTCYTGPEGTRNVGECKDGMQTCIDKKWGACVGDVKPAASDPCDGKDNNCDGKIDGDFPDLGKECTVAVGECARTGKYVCKADGTGTKCDATPGQPSPEICDGKDNNCDGKIDGDFPDLGKACTVGVGECASTGKYVCKADGTGTKCDATPGQPSPEICDGKDNNCDGKIDGDFPDLGKECTVGVGECASTGKYVCKADGTGTECDATTGQPSPEICDGKDNNCDGKIDEDVVCPNPTEICVQGQCVERPKCLIDADCSDQDICIGGHCYEPGCYKQTPQCGEPNALCIDGKCTPNACLNQTCDADSFCRRVDGKCVKPCADVSCPTGQMCIDGTCTKDPCHDKQCAAGEICVSGQCETDKCNTASACKFGRTCINNRCVEDPCADVKCPEAKQVCKAGQCVAPPSCKSDLDCPSNQLCIGGKCIIPECQKHGDCKPNHLCIDGKCKEDLCHDKQCPANQACHVGQCVDTCAGVFCKDGDICIDGKCVADPCHDKQCQSGEVCINGNCVENPCKEADSCKNGRVCVNGKCVDSPCHGVKCPPDQTCIDGQCHGERTCKTDSECSGDAICIDGKCSAAGCYINPCPEGQICIKGQCKDNPCKDITCNEGEVCQPADGKCHKVCQCADKHICKDGSCEPDPCADKQCDAGERCENGSCIKDLCLEPNADLCKHRRLCKNGSCADDPCQGVKCPSDFSCRDGLCHGAPITPEPAPEPIPDTHIEPVPDLPHITVGGGCACQSTHLSGTSIIMLFILLVFIFRLRRNSHIS
jgi:uncharacterized protein YegL